jgi:flagellar protein FliS
MKGKEPNMLGNYKAYQQQSIMTMTPSEILTTLYDALIKELSLSKLALAKKSYADANTHLQKCQRILTHLQVSLDFKYEISNNLDALYDYFSYVTVQANIHKNADGLDDIIGMIAELRDVYIEAAKQQAEGGKAEAK